MTSGASRPLAVSIFANEKATTPKMVGEAPWSKIIEEHKKRRIRPEKSGLMLGGYAITGTRANDNVPIRSLIQLDIDTQGVKEKATGRILEVTRAAPALGDIRSGIDEYEWCAASSHWHEPQRGVIKYRIVILPDRDIQPDEHEPLLEALDERLHGALDRDAWPWSQAFYLPSCPYENEGDAFFERNQGAPLPVDEFVRRGQEILEPKQAVARRTAPLETNIAQFVWPETPENIERVKSMLAAIDPDVARSEWRQVCWAAMATGWDCADVLIRDWSTAGETFTEKDFANVVRDFDPTKGTGFGTLVHHARQHGWKDLSAPPEGERFTGSGGDERSSKFLASVFRNRFLLEVSPDNIGETVDRAEEVLRNSQLPIFQRAGFIVRVGQHEEETTDEQKQLILSALELSTAGLGETLERVIQFEQRDARRRGNGTKSVHAPELVLKTFLDRRQLSGLASLTGVTDIPLIRRNGTLLDVPGYDEATGIYYKPSGLALDIPKDPTLDDAVEAIETLRHLLRDFPFQSDVDQAAAISAFITAVNRPTLGATPLHAFSAPMPGSGKSLLATLVTIIATGSLPNFITQGPNEEELEKRISSQMLAGRQVINLDNCNRPLRGAALCNLLTAERVSLRILGLSKMPEIASSSFILANGNNMRLADDMVRRTVMSHVDPKMERPEEREIDWDAKAEARRNRGRYVSACLTIMLAYRAAGAPKQTTPLGSFETWSRRVRDAIVWSGLPDPCANADKLREADPDLERFLNVAVHWEKRFGNAWKKLADVINEADQPANSTDDLKMALMNVADAGRDVSANRLAAFLGRYADRPLAGYKFVNRKGHAGTKLWRLEKVP